MTYEIENTGFLDMDRYRQVLADFLSMDPKEIVVCSARINDITTMQAGKVLYLVGTQQEVGSGIREYFRHNLGSLNSTFIGRMAKLTSSDAMFVDRLCEILKEDMATEILNEALLSIVERCGDLEQLINAAAEEVDRGEFLAMDGKENAFGEYWIYRFHEGQCSDFDY